MSDVYIVKNQNNHYASKQKEWVDGSNPKALFRSPHKDEAINMVFELSSKDINVRAEAISCELDESKAPIVEVLNPIPDPEPIPEASESPEAEEGADISNQPELAINAAEETVSEREAEATTA